MQTYNTYVTRTLKMTLLFVILLVSTYSCSEVSYPEDSIGVQLTARSTLLQNGNRSPLNDVQITATLISNGTNLSGRTGTDGQGTVILSPFNLPRVGSDIAVRAEHPIYGVRFDTLYGVCDNAEVSFLFDAVTPVTIDCNNLTNTSYRFEFTDPNTGGDLRRNNPASVSLCRTVFQNTGRTPVTISIPAASAPFTLTGVQIDGTAQPLANPTVVTLQPGRSLTLCYSVSTENTSANQPNGEFLQTISATITCPNQSATVTLELVARVVEESCDCQTLNEVVALSTSVPTGSTEDATYTFVNTSDCPITLTAVAITPGARTEWRIISPAILANAGASVVVPADSSITFTLRFSPLDPATGINDTSVVTFPFTLVTESGQQCQFNLQARGNSCSDACPTLIVRGQASPFFATQNSVVPRLDTLRGSSNGGRIRLRSSCGTGGVSTAEARYRFAISPLACEAGDISVSVQDVTVNGTLRPFTITPTTIPLSPGDTSLMEVVFNAPSVLEFNTLLASGGGPRPVTGTTADSAFTIRITFSNGGRCFHTLEVTAIITTLPDLSPVRNLRSFNQRTYLQPTAENEVYTFANAVLASLRTQAGPGPFPPDSGDIFIDILPANWNGTNQATFAPPYPPMLYLNNGSAMNPGNGNTTNDIGMFKLIKRWTPSAFPGGYPEARFNDPRQLLQDFEVDVRNNPGFFTNGFTVGPINPVPPPASGFGAVYVLVSSSSSAGVPCEIALMYVRSVNNGTEDNTNKQTAVEFRSAYPLLIAP